MGYKFHIFGVVKILDSADHHDYLMFLIGLYVNL